MNTKDSGDAAMCAGVLGPADLDRLGRLAIELPTWGFADTGTRFVASALVS